MTNDAKCSADFVSRFCLTCNASLPVHGGCWKDQRGASIPESGLKEVSGIEQSAPHQSPAEQVPESALSGWQKAIREISEPATAAVPSAVEEVGLHRLAFREVISDSRFDVLYQCARRHAEALDRLRAENEWFAPDVMENKERIYTKADMEAACELAIAARLRGGVVVPEVPSYVTQEWLDKQREVLRGTWYDDDEQKSLQATDHIIALAKAALAAAKEPRNG